MLEVVPTIRLIALDLDGTLLDPADNVSPANRNAIRQALEAGIRVVFVTGRGTDTPERLAHELEVNLPIICAHGALTKDFLSGKILGHIPVPLSFALPMIEYAEANDLDAAAYIGERFYRSSGRRAYMADMAGPGWARVPHLTSALSEAPTFLRFFGHRASRAIAERFADPELHFKRESWADLEELAVTSSHATKERALAELCRTLRIPADAVLAVGDSRNDVPMLRWAGTGVAMGNALPEVRDAVPHVTGRNDEDGVAQAIERFVLGPLENEKKSA